MNSPLLNADAVGDLLAEIGERLEAQGESPFKVKAYYNAASLLHNQTVPLDLLIARGELSNLPGIGKALFEKIETLHRTGSHPVLDTLRQDVPDGVLELLRLPGLGGKKAQQLRKELGIESLDALKAAAEAGRLRELKGFTAKTEAKLLKSLAFYNATVGQVRLPEAQALAELVRHQAVADGVDNLEFAGALRRSCETVRDVPVLTAHPWALSECAATKRLQFSIVTTATDRAGLELLFATGSDAHLKALQAHAETIGLKLEKTGLFKNGTALQVETEAVIYAALGLPWIAPEFREGTGEIEAALNGSLQQVISLNAYSGILHCHSTYSDGSYSLAEMAEQTRKLGMQYFGIADHSQSAAYAGGMKEERVLEQHAEIEALNRRYAEQGCAFRILKGIESDILEDGSLDYPDSFLNRFDYLVASVHNRFELDENRQTERILRAVAHPATTVLGHPTGRLLLRRPGYALDLPAVIKACAKNGVAIELNAHPMRLDLDWRWHEQVRAADAWISINPDAHHKVELDYYKLGVMLARKGRIPSTRVLNALSLTQLQEHVVRRRK